PSGNTLSTSFPAPTTHRRIPNPQPSRSSLTATSPPCNCGERQGVCVKVSRPVGAQASRYRWRIGFRQPGDRGHGNKDTKSAFADCRSRRRATWCLRSRDFSRPEASAMFSLENGRVGRERSQGGTTMKTRWWINVLWIILALGGSTGSVSARRAYHHWHRHVHSVYVVRRPIYPRSVYAVRQP